jgi:opacity protein-like surface antigen
MFGRALGLAILMVVAAAVSAAAQNNEVAAGIGRSFITTQSIKPVVPPLLDNQVHFSTAPSFEFSYARRLTAGSFFSLDAELPFDGTPTQKLHSGNGAVPSQYSAYFITPAARLKFFLGHAFQPWISGGGGYGHFHLDNTLVSGTANPGSTNKNSGIFEAGAGIDTKIFHHINLRAAGRDFISSEVPLNVDTGRTHQHNLIFTVGLGVHF